jgi:ubiquinone/menaquinone biosynthesis C-methylase UbiE
MKNLTDSKWDLFYKEGNRNLRFPDEDIIRLFCGPYIKSLPKSGKLLDHGFGSGNNIVFFASLGYKCAGIEVSLEAIKTAKGLLSTLGFSDVDLKLFDGQSIPFSDEEFDIIVSWNALHYNGTKEKVSAVLGEFRRILKPGGNLLISTVAPESSIIKDRGKNLGNDSYLLKGSEYDKRENTVFFCLPQRDSWVQMLKGFSDIKLGYQLTDLFLPDKIHASYIISCIRQKE